jgi:hypothetical protein
MAHAISTSITRRSMVAGLALTAAPMVMAGADNAYAQAKQTTPEKSLYERLGGVFAIAAVVDHFSDAVVKNPIVGKKSKNPQLREWHTKSLGRLPGLKFMRTLWVSATFRVGPSSTRPPSPARLRSALRRPTGTSGSHPQNSMRSQRNSDGPWISSRSRSMRRVKSWQPSPPTKTRSPPATSLSAAKACGVSQSRRSRSAKAGRGLLYGLQNDAAIP